MNAPHAYTTPTNDNSELTFQPLAAATARVLQGDKDQDEKAGRDANTSDRDEQKQRDQRDYVAQRLRELRAFERRANGGK
jgi:hypothetical protein